MMRTLAPLLQLVSQLSDLSHFSTSLLYFPSLDFSPFLSWVWLNTKVTCWPSINNLIKKLSQWCLIASFLSTWLNLFLPLEHEQVLSRITLSNCITCTQAVHKMKEWELMLLLSDEQRKKELLLDFVYLLALVMLKFYFPLKIPCLVFKLEF